MTAGRVIIGQDAPKPRRDRSHDLQRAARAVSLLCLMFATVGVVDVALALYPVRFQSPVTTFAVFGSVTGGLPILALGLVGFEVAALFGGARSQQRIGAVLNVLALAALLVGFGIFLSSIGSAFAGAPKDTMPSLRQTVVRGVTFYLLFGAAFGVAAWTGWRGARGEAKT